MSLKAENQKEALHLLTDGLCRIREAAVESPEHVKQMADALHNIPGILAGEDRADEAYLTEQLEKARSLIADRSWRGGCLSYTKWVVGSILAVIAVGLLSGVAATNYAKNSQSETVRTACIEELQRLADGSDPQEAAIATAVLAKRPCDKF